ncbi:hypothetical protein JMJ58_07050 [Haloterrigena salifodinae]|uniref:Blue (type 1) copper domain-containing protein n=1 Tax=Haloterrigena salifodinae TaxID=2675099 RepID=A0A8T8E565_9EURY|nr:hypothetical protein JMJ58_07050 [Haloterrigena salifodinae]
MTDRLSRRTILGITSGAIGSGIAGCLTGNSQEDDTTGHDHTDNHSDEGDHNESQDEETHSHGHGGELDSPSAEAEVTMATTESGAHFEPHVVWIETGGRVTWINESGSHSTTAYHPDNEEPQLVPDEAAAWDSGVLSAQEATFDHTFETEGVYHYYCTPHETAGMIGSVIVGQPDLETQPALEEPPSEKAESVREKLTGLNDTIRGALDNDRSDSEQNETESHDEHDH